MNMALRVGIENGLKKGFTKDEITLTNSFAMGVMAMVTGVGNIGGKCGYRGTNLSVQEAHDRFTVALEGLEIFNDQEPVKEIITLDFVQRMADAGWSCNVSNESKEEFLHKMCAQVMGNLLSRTRTKTLGTYYHQTSWNDLHSRRESVRMLIGTLLSEDEDSDYYMHEMIDSISCHFDFWHNEKFYGDKYLIYDEETNRFSLSDENPNEEE
jgi:hypothetical protein